jgi:sporulation protein YlmC with PRC-barrel domain
MDNIEKENWTGIHHKTHLSHKNKTYLTAKTIIGDKVKNLEGEVLGEIKDLMLDVESGSIKYVILESGGFLGLKEKLFAYQYNRLKLDSENKCFILNEKKESIKNAPGFDKNYWPLANNDHLIESDAYWGDFMGPSTG